MIEQTPIIRNSSFNKEAYRGLATAQMRILKDYMKVGGLNVYSRVVTLANGVVITCQKSFNRENIFISVPQAPYTEVVVKEEFVSGIIFHPRSGAIEMLPYTEYVVDELGSHAETKYLAGVKGGWQDGKTELTTPYIYPLVDADNASFVVTKPKEVLEGEFTGDTGNYGNLYWWNGDEKKPVYLSWKGTPSRHFRLPGSIEIPGFSIFETSRPGAWEDTPEYTAFGTKLYSQGRVLAEAPQWSWPYDGSGVDGKCLLLGALQNSEGKIYIVTQSDHYNAPENVFIFSDGHREEGADELKNLYLNGKPDVTCVFEKTLTKPGFFLGLWEKGGVVSGWTLINEVAYSRNGLPWFGNAVGTEFVCGNGDKLSIAGMLTGLVSTSGTWKETAELTGVVGADNPLWPEGMEFHNAAAMTFNAAFALADYHEPENSSLVQLVFQASSQVLSTDSVYKTYTGNYPLKIQLNTLFIYQNESWSTGMCFIASGGPSVAEGEPMYTWSSAGGSIDAVTGCITNPDGMCSITVEDCKGRTATIANYLTAFEPFVNGPAGVYVGATYSMANGIAPLTYSSSGFTVNSGGVVTAIGGCNNLGSITITDACGRSATKTGILQPGGIWITDPSNDANWYTCSSCWVRVWSPGYVGGVSMTGISSSNWYKYGSTLVSEAHECCSTSNCQIPSPLGANTVPWAGGECEDPRYPTYRRHVAARSRSIYVCP